MACAVRDGSGRSVGRTVSIEGIVIILMNEHPAAGELDDHLHLCPWRSSSGALSGGGPAYLLMPIEKVSAAGS